MLPALTPAVVRSIEAASRYVFASSMCEPLHLLHGLLEEEEGAAVALAIRAGLDFQRYCCTRGDAGQTREVPLSPSSEALLYRAREIAFDIAGEGVVSSEALLLSLVSHDEASSQLLAAHGFQLTRLEAILMGARPAALPLEEPLHLSDLTERVEIARILDAGFNRAREALRVIEDYTRFALDDAFLSSRLKQFRHDLTTAFEEMAPPRLLQARDTEQDVGTTIRTDREYERASLHDVVRANCKRLGEALRSLEEFAKIQAPLLAERIEQLRYQAYTLERAIHIGEESRRTLQDALLYVLLSGSTCSSSLEWTVAEAAAGGASVIQLREKHLNDRDLVARARDVRRWTLRAGVLFIMNDRPDIARLVEADGVHLGQEDMTVKDARRILGPDALIGVSTHSLEQLRRAILDGANYVGIGPVFASGTKSFEEFAGLDYVRSAAAETTLPAFAIGGINPDTIPAAVQAGARRVAVSGAISSAEEPRRVASQLIAALT